MEPVNQTAIKPNEQAAAVMSELFELAPLLARRQSEGLAKRHMSQTRIRVLFALDQDGPLIMHELSIIIDVTPRAITTLVDGLEQAGLIKRCAHPTDRRATVVALTRRGRDTCKAMRASHYAFADNLLGGCDPDDLDATIRILAQVRAGLEKGRPAPA
jgi:DNA-binding MarR family transcriptional regulator